MSHRATRIALFLVLGLTLPLLAQSKDPPGPKPPIPGTPPTDEELVERLRDARRSYQVALEQLRAHYLSVNDTDHAKLAEEELLNYHRILKDPYNLKLDVPPPTLRAAYNIPEANELYIRAMSYKGKGWSNDYTDNQRRAELLLQQLLSSYPQSDKIGDTAYQLGDLYEGKAYRQYQRAALYFERCFQWHPNTQLDARLRAARLYDRTLMQRDRAIELYKEIVNHETDVRQHEEAKKRLQELRAGK